LVEFFEKVAVSIASESRTVESSAETRRRINLGGVWERCINGERWDLVTVPCSLRLSGVYVLKRTIWLPRLATGERAFIHFEGVTYHAEVTINGTKLGETGPYVPYEVEATRSLREGENKIEVTIRDLVVGPNGAGRDAIAIGVNPGWEAYSGIIREVWIEIRPAAFVKSVRLAYTMPDDFSRAPCRVGVSLDSAVADTAGEVTVSFLHGLNEIARASSSVTIRSGEVIADVRLEIEKPLLWSPDVPHLYTLVTTVRAGSRHDTVETRTGFRKLKILRGQFFWNGEPLVLQGFCRHDMWGNQGFTLTHEQMRQDMHAIKSTGANFVRLVHYPHHRYIVDLAEELGLLVTEEPGYWQVKFPSMPASEIDAGLRIMEGVIRRDWNSPAVFGWFLGNESRLTVEYLRRGKALCNELDPLQRPVSFANDTSEEKAKKQFEEAGLDFFSQHLYDFDGKKFQKTADYYGQEKPLMIDEWGWEVIGKQEVFWERSFDHLLDAMKQGMIAGHSFWSWNDVRQYARIDWSTHDGILFSGVVTERRQPREQLYRRLSALFHWRAENQEGERLPDATPFEQKPTVVPLRVPVVMRRGKIMPLNLQGIVDSPACGNSWKSLEQAMEKFWSASEMAQDQWARTGKKLLFWQEPEIEVAGIRFAFPLQDGFVRPLVLTQDVPEISIPVAQHCDWIYLMGNVTFPSGYPLKGKMGAVAATLDVHYQSGGKQQIPLRNGIEIASANLIENATRIEPLALDAPRALIFQKDPAREHYQVLMFGFPTHGVIRELRLHLNSGPPLAIFAISAQKTFGEKREG
jgi:beta-glucuronidase